MDDEPSKAALTHAPGGRDALLILGFFKNNEERAALSEGTIGPQNILAACDSERQETQTNFQEFVQDFFNHVNANKSDKDQSHKNTSTKTKIHDRDDDDEPGMEPGRERGVKRRAMMENLNPDNLTKFNAGPEAEELKIAKESFKDYKNLNQCETDSLRRSSTFATAATSHTWKSTELRNRHPGIRFDDEIKAYTDILGPLMQATEGPVMDKFQTPP